MSRFLSNHDVLSLSSFITFFTLVLTVLNYYGCSPVNEGYILENKRLEVQLNKNIPSIKKYVLKETKGVLFGNTQDSPPEVLIYKGAHSISGGTEVSYSPDKVRNGVVYHSHITYNARPVVEFNLVYTLNENELTIELNEVVEHEDFYLIHVVLPGIITVTADQTGARIVIPADAGRLVDITRADPKDYDYEIDWRNPILAGIAYYSEAVGILNTESIENHTIARIFEDGDGKSGSFSMKLIHRLKEYDLEEFGPVVPVTDPERLLKVQDSCSITISVVGDYDDDGCISWIDGSKVLRDEVNAVPNPYYLNKTFIRTFVDRPPTSRDSTGTREELPFESVLDRIRQFATQTDSAACVMYLLGWQYEGHDSGYPSVDKVNENLGGMEELVRLIEEARKYNVTVTFYDNYDDSYPNHPGWDPDVICRDPQGNLMKGGVWEGNQSYLISSYKYAVKSGLDRVRFTLERYPIREAYFIDVLAGGYNGGRKYDFNPDSPAGAQKNLEGKLMIINEFNKHGVDVATEDFTGFFVGHVGTFGDIIAYDDTYFSSEDEIPLIPFIYHSKTSFGMKISDRGQYVKTFLYGQRAQKFTNSRIVYSPAEFILDALPKQKLYGKAMRSYDKSGTLERVIYEDGSTVEVDVEADKYKVVLGNGMVIAMDYTSFVPVTENAYMACSREGGTLSYPIPDGWSEEEKITVYRLNSEGTRMMVDVNTVDGNIEFHTEPEVPYKVVYQ